MGIKCNGKKMVIYEMNIKRGPPWLLVKMVYFLFMGIFWDLWENGIYFYGFGIIFDGRCL
jgi:hypothetical protein